MLPPPPFVVGGGGFFPYFFPPAKDAPPPMFLFSSRLCGEPVHQFTQCSDELMRFLLVGKPLDFFPHFPNSHMRFNMHPS